MRSKRNRYNSMSYSPNKQQDLVTDYDKKRSSLNEDLIRSQIDLKSEDILKD
jgi:hypothetical protein